jgi:hypothetical protein
MSNLPMNGRWNNQSSYIGPPPHMQQQQPPSQQQTSSSSSSSSSSSWNPSSMSHGFPPASYVDRINELVTNMIDIRIFRSRRPMPSMNNSQMSTGKGQNNPFSFLPSTSQNQSSMNTHRRLPMMNNLISSNNGPMSAGPMMNSDLGQHFSSVSKHKSKLSIEKTQTNISLVALSIRLAMFTICIRFIN